jgi:hypothetical protein
MSTQSLVFAVKYRFCSRHLYTRQMESEGRFGRPDFGLRDPDATHPDILPCSHHRVADRDRCDLETSQSIGRDRDRGSSVRECRTRWKIDRR